MAGEISFSVNNKVELSYSRVVDGADEVNNVVGPDAKGDAVSVGVMQDVSEAEVTYIAVEPRLCVILVVIRRDVKWLWCKNSASFRHERQKKMNRNKKNPH